MAALTSAQKKALPDSAFAYIGPDGERHFPYRHTDGSLDEEHVRKGLQLLSTAKIPASAKAKVRRILLAAAKKLGIESSQEKRVGSGGSVVGRKVERSASDSAMLGLRASAPELTRAILPCTVRIADEERREIEVCATSEAVDTYGTVFSYEASKDAFTRWAGNVREMHERKAVGRKVAVRFDDQAKRVYARLRISAGAQDTWEKVKDGTLAGASIGASNVTWDHQRVGDRSVPVATRYDLMELSLVDLPSNPDARGVTFVRDGVPDAALLDDVVSDGGPQSSANSIGSSVAIREGAGVVAADDPAAAIAAAALARGQVALDGHQPDAPTDTVHSPKAARLAALGAPGYVGCVVTGSSTVAELAVTRVDTGPGSTFDGDGDHDGNVPAGGMGHSEGMHAHASHDHPHTGDYEDTHDHSGAHVHLDGTSHTHDHSHDHGHHNHNAMRVQRGHSHAHVHTHDHSHYYRVADGSPIDESLVTGEQLRSREYVSEEAFRTSGGRDGMGLTAAQYRIAAGVEARLEMEAAERVQGPYSRNPYGAADIGTPAPADEPSTEEAQPSTGQIRQLDRDGQPAVCDTSSSTGTLDVSQAPDGYMELADGRAVAAEVTRAVTAEITRLAGSLSEIQQRLAKIEAQPQSGGPVLRVADKGTPLASSGSSPAERIRALEGLAGRISDPQAQVAVAAEMIRLQQEAMGLPPAMQVMPRAGSGSSGAR